MLLRLLFIVTCLSIGSDAAQAVSHSGDPRAHIEGILQQIEARSAQSTLEPTDALLAELKEIALWTENPSIPSHQRVEDTQRRRALNVLANLSRSEPKALRVIASISAEAPTRSGVRLHAGRVFERVVEGMRDALLDSSASAGKLAYISTLQEHARTHPFALQSLEMVAARSLEPHVWKRGQEALRILQQEGISAVHVSPSQVQWVLDEATAAVTKKAVLSTLVTDLKKIVLDQFGEKTTLEAKKLAAQLLTQAVPFEQEARKALEEIASQSKIHFLAQFAKVALTGPGSNAQSAPQRAPQSQVDTFRRTALGTTGRVQTIEARGIAIRSLADLAIDDLKAREALDAIVNADVLPELKQIARFSRREVTNELLARALSETSDPEAFSAIRASARTLSDHSLTNIHSYSLRTLILEPRYAAAINPQTRQTIIYLLGQAAEFEPSAEEALLEIAKKESDVQALAKNQLRKPSNLRAARGETTSLITTLKGKNPVEDQLVAAFHSVKRGRFTTAQVEEIKDIALTHSSHVKNESRRFAISILNLGADLNPNALQALRVISHTAPESFNIRQMAASFVRQLDQMDPYTRNCIQKFSGQGPKFLPPPNP